MCNFRSKRRPKFVLQFEPKDSSKPSKERAHITAAARECHIVHFYRAAQLIQYHYCRLFQGRLLPDNFIMSYFVVIGLFCLIRFYHTFTWEIKGIIIIAVISGYFGWAVVLWGLGQYFISSRKFLLSWKNFDFGNTQTNKVMRAFFRSCRPVELVTNPRLIRFRLQHVFKYMHFINWGLCKVLVATQKFK